MKIKIGFFAIMLILSLLLSDHNFALAAILSVIIHECGHIFAARLLKINMRECKIDIFVSGNVNNAISIIAQNEDIQKLQQNK